MEFSQYQLLCLVGGAIMSFHNIIRIADHPLRADQSAMCAINRHLRLDFVNLHNWTPIVMHQTIGQRRPEVILSGAPPAPIVPEETLVADPERIL